MTDIREALKLRYRKFQSEADIPLPLAKRLSPPLLLYVSESWPTSKYRVLVIGQETLGWQFKSDNKYEYDWPYQDMANFGDFRRQEAAVEALIYAYKIFDYSRHQPLNRRGCFWTAYRKLLSELENGVNGSMLWTNLFRMSLAIDEAEGHGSVIRNARREDLITIQKAQKDLLADEVSILHPNATIFFTGPSYDEALQREFVGANFSALGSHTSREASILSHSRLPLCSIRTYHPTYLRYRKLSAILDEITQQISRVPLA